MTATSYSRAGGSGDKKRRYGNQITPARPGVYLSHPLSLEHETGSHPENARRIGAIESRLETLDWLGMERELAPAATREQLERVHDSAHIGAIETLCAKGGGMIDLDTVASERSFDAALRSAGGAARGAERVLAGEASFAFAGLRPPGHHAETDRAMGFCLFNGVAVAAEHAIAECEAERVLILDWDVHHGNGTQEIFYESGDVLYASIHQSPMYPGSGDPAERGSGPGEGTTLNMPVAAGAGPDEFLALVQHVVVPVARSFEPGLIAISAGFDAHRDDPLAQCRLDEDAFAEMAATMRDLGAELEAPLLVVLEGGYDLGALSASVAATLEALGGDRVAREAPREAAAPHLARAAT
ncbi:MAG: histone deacetylase family protein [Solirubrobacterales bacterium]